MYIKLIKDGYVAYTSKENVVPFLMRGWDFLVKKGVPCYSK